MITEIAQERINDGRARMLAQKIERGLLSLMCKVPCCESREVDACLF